MSFLCFSVLSSPRFYLVAPKFSQRGGGRGAPERKGDRNQVGPRSSTESIECLGRSATEEPQDGLRKKVANDSKCRDEVLDRWWFWSTRLVKNAGLRGFAERDRAVKRAVAVMISAGPW